MSSEQPQGRWKWRKDRPGRVRVHVNGARVNSDEEGAYVYFWPAGATDQLDIFGSPSPSGWPDEEGPATDDLPFLSGKVGEIAEPA